MMRVWAGLLSALAVILTFWGITSLMAAGLWQWHLVAFPLLVLIVMSLPTIAAKRFPLAAPITAAVGGVLVWIGYVGYLVPGASLLPTPNSLRVIGNHLQTAMLEIIEAYRPAQATDLILPLALVGLGPVCLLVIFLAVVARRPIWAGLPLIGCWAVFLVGDPASGLGSALSAGVAYLLLIGLTERGFRRRRPREVAMTPVVALATVVGLFIALVGPALPGWGDAYDWPGKLPFNKSAIDPEKPISVEDFFQVPSNEKILRVKGEVTGPLKVASYRNFDGREWVPGNDYFTEAYYESGRWVQDGEVWAKPPDAETTVIAVYLGQEDALGPVISYEIEPMPPNVVYPGDRNGPIFPNRWDAWDLLTVLYPHSRGEYELPRGLDIQFDPETGVIAIGPSPDVLGGGGSGRYALYNREGGGLFASGLIGGWGYDYGYREYTVPQVPPLEHWSAADPFVVEMIQANGRGLPTAIGPRALTMEDAPPPRYNYEMDAFLYSRTLMETATYRVYPMTLDRSRLGEYEGEDLEEITAWLSGQISGENRTIVIMGSDLDVVLSQTWGIELGHYDEVRALTWSVIGSAQTQHEQLLAIQAYLRGPEFSYTLAPNWGDHDDPVWGFLQTKRGYCIHFATAMVAMATTIGIPGRVSVGYNLGPVAADGWRYATGGQAHMWPEFHYGETGWVPYEPTPAAGIQAPREVSTENPTAGPSLPEESLEPTPGTSEKPSTEAPTVLSPVAGVAFGAVGLGLGAVVGGLAWRGSFTDERTWRLIRRRGQRWGWFDEGTSVRSAVERLEGQGLVWMGLREFRDDLEARWYGPDELRPAAMPAREAYALWRQVRRLY